MNPRSLLALHLPTLTEVVDEASIPQREDEWPVLADDHAHGHEPALANDLPVVDLSDPPSRPVFRTPTPQEVDSLRGDESPFEATITDHEIRRALADVQAASPVPLDLALGDVAVPSGWPGDDAHVHARVLDGVQRQVDVLLEHRLREALAPLLAQTADTLMTQAREVLASSLRELVAQAVAHEIERQRDR